MRMNRTREVIHQIAPSTDPPDQHSPLIAPDIPTYASLILALISALAEIYPEARVMCEGESEGEDAVTDNNYERAYEGEG